MKCANCNADAFYVYKITLTKEILYCPKHLPSFLNDRKNAGLLPTTETYKTIVEEGKQNLAAPVDKPVAEEIPVAEPEPIPTPTPTKKPTKKAATKNAPNS